MQLTNCSSTISDSGSILECNYSYKYIYAKSGLFAERYILYIYIREKGIFINLFEDLINRFSNKSIRA